MKYVSARAISERFGVIEYHPLRLPGSDHLRSRRQVRLHRKNVHEEI